MNVIVQKAENQEQLTAIYQVRKMVFVVEQHVPEEEEIDAYEPICQHFAAVHQGLTIGAARWRIKEEKAKLERFAVLKEWRGHGVGQALIQAVLQDIEASHPGIPKVLHAQLAAVNLYARFGFQKVGPQFDECGIMHYQMIKD